MFSEQGFWQEVAAVVIATTAAIYLLHRVTGWPKLRGSTRRSSPQIVTSRRLARGLAKVRRQ